MLHDMRYGAQFHLLLFFQDLGETDPACLESSKAAEDDILKFDYHVLYSESYGVPVLYFNVYRQGMYHMLACAEWL